MMSREPLQIGQIAELGISNFETEVRVQRLQIRLNQILRGARVSHPGVIGLANCTVDKCGREKCSEACYFGAYRRRMKEIPAAFRLISEHAGPVCLVRVARSAWVRPVGELASVSIGAIKQLNRRALDSLCYPGLVAVGTITVHLWRQTRPRQWAAGIEQVVAGAPTEELERAYSIGASGELSNIICRVTKVLDFDEAISTALRRRLVLHKPRGPISGSGGWRRVRPADMVSPQPDAVEWAEYFQWLTSLPVNVRLLRYGCDRHFNQLAKQSRLIRWRLRKMRPYPYWLAPWQFGNHPRDCRCRACTG
jgi:hypothetical protein